MKKTALLSLLSLASYFLFWPTNIEPKAWYPQPAPPAEGIWAPNNRLDHIIEEKSGIIGPDTVIVDSLPRRYSGLSDGRIVRWSANTPLETFVKLKGRPVGLNFDVNGNLYAADEEKSYIWMITPKGEKEIIVQNSNGMNFNLIDDLYIDKKGRIFFTDASSRWSLAYNKMAILEHGGDGRLFVREPTGEIRLIMEKLEFPNGVVLSPDESYILVAETGAYRITRIWLTGSKAGEVESLLENLPGFPGDLSIAPDGTYWTTLFSPRKKLLDLLAPWPSIRKILSRLPPAWLPKATPYPYLIRFNNKGEVIETLQASKNTKGIPSFSSAAQTDNELLLGTPGGVGEIDSNSVYRIKLNE